jgi:PAS domain S-box-containing protein
VDPDTSTALPDLSQCDLEPIHIPGAIQPHGVLLALYGPTWQITQVSTSCETWLGMVPSDLLARELTAVLGTTLAEAVGEALARYDELPDSPMSFTWQAGSPAGTFAGHVHRSESFVILELEPLPTLTASTLGETLAQALRHFGAVRAQPTLAGKLSAATRLFRRLTGYDRVMIYRFDSDWHGEVIAEDRREDLESFLGLHYPASDIPAQARRLYLISPTRLIADIDAVPAVLVPPLDPIAGRPLDLSRSVLRAVSPVHLEYLRNMGVQASLSAPLIRDGQLWGLIACHHDSPNQAVGDIRQLTAWIAQDLSNEIALTEEVDARQGTSALKRCRDRILAAIRQGTRLPELLNDSMQGDLLGVAGAEGVALILDDEVILTGGETPPLERLRAIDHALSQRLTTDAVVMFATDCLSEQLDGVEDLAATAAGVLFLPLNGVRSIRLMWLRSEQLRQVTWGGNPDKAASLTSEGRISPRKSFAAWSTLVRGHSRRWRDEELESARELGALIDIEWRREAEEALRASEARLQRVLNGTNDGFWDWDMLTGEVHYSQRWIQILGYEPSEIAPSLQGWEALVHPEDLPRCQAALQAHIAGVRVRYECEHRLRAKDGTWRWVLGRGRITGQDARGRPLCMAGTITDISDRRHAEEALRASLAEMQRHDAWMVALNRMNDLLLACETREEAYPIIAQGAAALFAPHAGGLAVIEGQAAELRWVGRWGATGRLPPSFQADDCWALRRGKTHAVAPDRAEIACRHFLGDPPPSALCVPLSVRGALLGLLHIHAEMALDDRELDDLRTLATTVSESVKLALSNIVLREAVRGQSTQ